MAVYILNSYIIVFISHHRLGLYTSFYQFTLKLLKPPPRVPRPQTYDSKRKSSHISNILLGNLLNYISRFIAYNFCERNKWSVRIARKLWKIQGVAWTICNADDYKVAIAEDWIPIFENFKP